MNQPPNFSEIDATRPNHDKVVAQYATITQAFDDATSADGRINAVGQWDKIRKDIETWSSLTHLNFHQDTKNEDYKAERDYSDEIAPQITELDVGMKRKLLDSEHRADVEKVYGTHCFDLWRADITTFDAAIKDDLVQEAKLYAEYTELLASAKLDFDGGTHNLTGMAKFASDGNRDTRHGAGKVLWQYMADNQERLDSIFDELVKLRAGMAQKLGFDNYVGLGYKRMQRIDYKAKDVESFRQQVREVVVPLSREIRKRQASKLGVDKLMFWDQMVHDPQGNPSPNGDHVWITAQARTMFNNMGSELSGFFNMMADNGFLDLDNRDTKAGGGFCTSFPNYGVPFIFTNFNGTTHDIEVLAHEAGHAFQNWLSRDKAITDYIWPTYESCEIHSMSLEFLTWPHMGLFFGDDAERFRQLHLTKSLLFLPYGVAVDHFQHMIYENPGATPKERNEMWLEMNRTYEPWTDYGDIGHLAQGGRWQLQRHIYGMPFYYIDYTLAQTCALQFWARSQEDYADALSAYTTLCRRGGEAPFQALATSAGLVSPFADGCLNDVVAKARVALDI